MPVNGTDIKLQGKFARARRKIKDAGVGLAAAVASLAPMRGVAQDRVIDADNAKISVVVDAVRVGMTVENKSSSNKKIFIHRRGIGMRNRYLDRDGISNNIDPLENAYSLVPSPGAAKGTNTKAHELRLYKSTNSDSLGVYYNLVHSALVSVNGNKYTYNTDAIYDKYLTVAKRVFKRANKVSKNNIIIHVYCVGPLDQVVLYEMVRMNTEKICFGTMILDAATGDLLHYSKEQQSGIQSFSELEMIAYQRDGEDGRIAHVWDANAAADYVYKSSEQNGIIRSFKISEQTSAKRAAVLMEQDRDR